MNFRGRRQRLWKWLLCGTGAVLMALPDAWTASIRQTVRDLLVPGLTVTVTARESFENQWAVWSESLQTLRTPTQDPELNKKIARLQSELDDAKLQLRRQQLKQLELTHRYEEFMRYGSSPGVPDLGLPLVNLDLLECRVLGEESSALWRRGQLIQGGSRQNIEESALVLDSPFSLIDQGADADLDTGLPVFAGKCVIGRIVKVGRWTSVVQPLTDRNFRGGLVQLCRQSDDGPLWGTVGMIEGQGVETNLCRLTAVPATEAVSVGDHVYTAIEDGVLPGGMYYGEVVRAELKVGSPHWDIDVRPAATVSQLQRVQVLRRIQNPQRPLAN
ncbi:MAG: rod shape-determining protein MreC [Planctomycetota bacterium]|nr:rod shape-determining protein MreC [Planctomycetota bacterium]